MSHRPGPYRDNVGIVVFNPEGRVWLGRRAHTPPPHNWQFPQGGVDPGEDLLDAARRELQEETGIVSVSLLAAAEQRIAYDFPPEHRRSKAAHGYRGQSQAWFAFRFEGRHDEIDLDAHPHVEFDAWRWAELDEAAELVIPFKRDAYAQVISAFSHLPEVVRASAGG
jgi:putative (di)nucleoside polyphosphate hydrolase